MNCYVVVEGASTEPQVYRRWIPLVNPDLRQVDAPFDLSDNTFCMVSGGGYPRYFDVIRAAAADAEQLGNVDRLVVSVDAEEMTVGEKLAEMEAFLETLNTTTEVRLIVQHFCLEAWALGNKSVGPHQPQTDRLRRYKAVYNVLQHDPEHLPCLAEEDLNRSQFAYKYLRAMLAERGPRTSYTKRNPGIVAHPTYYEALVRRLVRSHHIRSFQMFLDAFAA